MKILDAFVQTFFGIIIGMIIIVGIYGNRIDKYKSLVDEYRFNESRCTEILLELQSLAHRQNDFIQELTH